MGWTEGAKDGFLAGLRVGLCLGAFDGLRVGLETSFSTDVRSVSIVNTTSSFSGAAGDASEVKRLTTRKMTASADRTFIFEEL